METEYSEYHRETQKWKWLKKFLLFFIIIFIILPIIFFFTFFFISGTTENFPVGKVFDIKSGMNISEIANFLEKEKIIKSATIFKIYDRLESEKKNDFSGIPAGKYTFKDKLDIFGVYKRLKNGESGIDDIKITIIEGDANFTIAKKFESKFKNITENDFLKGARSSEGFLYPDTYQFSPYSTVDFVVKKMKENFYKKNKKIIMDVEKSNKSLEKIVIMASIIEREAGNASVKIQQKVSGILWRRIEIGMMLQVDATFDYISKKHIPIKYNSHLKIDSPYNTYKNKGLPPSPIGNPSDKAIYAAMHPTETTDLFYLTGKDGNFYYAKTNRMHEINKSKYIKNYVKK